MFGKPEGMKSLGRQIYRVGDNIKVNHEEF
jgi:hypothetical protein